VVGADGALAGLRIGAAEPAAAFALLIIAQRKRAEFERAADIVGDAQRHVRECDAAALCPVSQRGVIHGVGLVLRIEVLGNGADGGGAAVRDAGGLLLAAVTEHGVKGERAAEPLGLHSEHIEVQRDVNRVDIFITLLLPLAEDAADVALTLLEFVYLSVVAQLRGAGADFRPAEAAKIISAGPIRFLRLERSASRSLFPRGIRRRRRGAGCP
jgi:hypothetical protein